MTTTETPNSDRDRIIELAPSFKIPLFLVILAIPLGWLNLLTGIICGVLGLFLMFQTTRIRLQFTSVALDIYSSSKMIRSFPYSEWTNWRIFWQPVPILFYFREVKSIHFLPILFDPQTLQDCLTKYCPKK